MGNPRHNSLKKDRPETEGVSHNGLDRIGLNRGSLSPVFAKSGEVKNCKNQ